jgi:hypothetical protein
VRGKKKEEVARVKYNDLVESGVGVRQRNKN